MDRDDDRLVVFQAKSIRRVLVDDEWFFAVVDDSFYIQKILQYICLKGYASRSDIVKLLKKHLSATLSDNEQSNKISNLLSVTLSNRKKLIRNTAGKGGSCWVLTAAGATQCRLYNQSCRKTCKRSQEVKNAICKTF